MGDNWKHLRYEGPFFAEILLDSHDGHATN